MNPGATAAHQPRLAIEGALDERLRAATQALVRIELAGEMVPSLDWFITPSSARRQWSPLRSKARRLPSSTC
jgi:hypothetical protein